MGVAFDLVYKVLIPGFLIVGAIVFILATTKNIQAQSLLACQVIGIIFMAVAGVLTYLSIMNKAASKDDWLITFEREPDNYHVLLKGLTDHLRKKDYTFETNPDLRDNAIMDPNTKELLMEEFVLSGNIDPELRVRIIIRDVKRPDHGSLEIRNVQKKNLSSATVLASELFKMMKDLNIPIIEDED